VVDEVFYVHAGREKSVAATKTYTGQMMALYLLAYAMGAPIRPASLERLPEVAERTLTLKEEIRRLSERYRYMNNAVVVGRGLNYANAFEFALKMMETCYVVAERFSGADFMHGPIALVERAFPVFLFVPPGPTLESSVLMLRKLKELEAETIVITQASYKDIRLMATRSIGLPGKPVGAGGGPEDLMTPVPYIIPAQLFAAFLAEQKGLDPDHPRTLSKVTKTI
jgi:glucosamine--fructose-6-phosphate aminotransferase (isomerizing)